MDFINSTDLSEFFTKEDILEVITDLKDTPFTGHFVSHDYEFICLCDSEGNKSVVPNSHVKYITSHKEKSTENFKDYETSDNSDAADNSDHSDNSEAAETLAAESSDDLYSPYPKPSLKIVDKIDLDEIYRRNSRKKDYKETYPSYSQKRYEDPLSKLYPAGMGVVKSTGKKFGFITDNEGNDLCFQSYNVLGRVFVGDKVTFTSYDHPKGRQARCVMKVCSVRSMLEKMEEMRYERYGKSQIADMVAQLKESFPDNDLVTEALRDSGFDHYKVREHFYKPAYTSEISKEPEISNTFETSETIESSEALDWEEDFPEVSTETPEAPDGEGDFAEVSAKE